MQPDLTLVFVISWVLLQGRDQGILLSLLSGFILDTLSGAPFGLLALSLVLTSWLAGLGELNVFRTARLLPYITIALASAVFKILFLFFLQMTGRTVMWWPLLGRNILPTIVINTLLMGIIFRLCTWLVERLRPRRVEWQ